MPTISIPRSIFDLSDERETLVCAYCDTEASEPYCTTCNEYKGIMKVSEWEAYTGETWED